jgi:hypothetical protein
MEWYRVREVVTKHQLAMSRFNMRAEIDARMVRTAKEAGALSPYDRLVFLRRDDDWYVTFGLEVNPPEPVIEKLRKRGWEVVQ